MGVEAFITKHFGGVPRSFKDLAWIIRVRPNDPPIVPSAEDYRIVSPGSQPNFARPKEDKINANYYYTRDVRRAYPATAVYTNEDIKKLVGASQARCASTPFRTRSGTRFNQPPSPDLLIHHAYRLASASAAATETGISAALPPSPPGQKYRYSSALHHLGPSEMNPELNLRGFK
ncbi:hypothetical protein BC830DRAFT_1252670 [Chytriomyces sp. MP71]|nr:hypothetical protein BC830DRAFT_1252670 [Chytriomyces sp. MP71]